MITELASRRHQLSHYYRYNLITFSIIYLAVYFNPACLHWAMIPLIIVAQIVSGKVIGWFKTNDVLNIRLLCAVFGYYYFFIVPLIDLLFSVNINGSINNPEAGRNIVGFLSITNTAFLLLFNYIITHIEKNKSIQDESSSANIYTSFGKILALLVMVLFISLILFNYSSINGLIRFFDNYDPGVAGKWGVYQLLLYPLPLVIYFIAALIGQRTLKDSPTAIFIFLSIILLHLVIGTILIPVISA